MEQKKFLTGFVSGMAVVCLLVGVLLFSGKLGIYSGYQGGSGSEKITASEHRKVLNKLTLLEQYIDEYYLNDLKAEALGNGLYKGLISSLDDQYAAYYTKEEMEDVKESTEGKYVGIGAYVSYDDELKAAKIIKPYEDGPADKAGIKAGDIIVTIDGKDVTGKDLTSVVSRMKGKEGTKVKIGVSRNGEAETKEFKVTRKKVETNTVSYQMFSDKIGYIGIASFKESTVEQFRYAVEQLEKQGMKGLIFDVRDNGGGSLSAVVDMLDRILAKGVIVSVKDKNGKGEVYKSTNKESLDIPMVCLVNGNSASASEVFAGALKDRDVAKLIGTKTFGKGIVQTIYYLNDGSAIKLTTAKYYTPSGKNIHKVGIEPDVNVELDESIYEMEDPQPKDDNQLQKAVSVLKKEMK